MKQWKQDKKFSDKFLPEIKRILGEHLLVEDKTEDVLHNSDLVVLKMKNLRIACRVRRYKYYNDYKHQFTIRRTRPSGVKSELSKIIEGWGDYLFYGFASENEMHLKNWFVGDLNVFRRWFNQQLFLCDSRALPGIPRNNNDGSSDFIAFDIDELPSEFIKATYPKEPTY